MRTRFFWILLAFAGFGALQADTVRAQSGSGADNPFEITNRLPKVDTIQSAPANPFDVVAHRPPGVGRQLVGEGAVTSESEGPLISIPRGNNLSWSVVFWYLLVITVFFTFTLVANRGVIVKAWRSFLTENALNSALREATGQVGSRPYMLLYISFLLQAGLFIFLVAQAFHPELVYRNWAFFALCAAGVWIIYPGKHVIIALVRWLIPSAANDLTRYNFLMVIFNCVLGVFLIPFNFLVAFAGNTDKMLFLALWTLGLAAIFYLYRIFRSLLIGLRYIGSDFFHFLLYLCAVEIVPPVILIKLFL